MNTSEFLMIAASVVPDRVALICEGESRTFAELQERVNRLANALQSLGIGKGDKVAVMALNSIPYVETSYACARVGRRSLALPASIRPQFETVEHFVCYDAKPEGMTSYEALLAAHDPEELFVD